LALLVVNPSAMGVAVELSFFVGAPAPESIGVEVLTPLQAVV
jgi:hypothetical protein